MKNTDPQKYRVGADATIEDVDLDQEDIHLPDGSRLTEDRARDLAEQALRRGAGRPSLSGRNAESPQLGVRVSPDLHARIQARSAAEGKPASQIIREALEHYV